MKTRSNIWLLLSPLFVVAVVIVLLAPRNAKFSYEYKKGQVWKYETLFATFDFPILKTEAQLMKDREDAANTYVPYYYCNPAVVTRCVREVENNPNLGSFRTAILESLKYIYSKGVLSDEGVYTARGAISPSVIYIQTSKRAATVPVYEVFLLTDARTKLYSDLAAVSGSVSADSLLKANSIYDLVVPNLEFDKQTSDIVNNELALSVSPTIGYVSTGQLIVSNGELITDEIAQILDSYKKEYESSVGYSTSSFRFWFGNTVLALALMLVLFFCICIIAPNVFRDSRYRFIVTVILLSAVSTLLTLKINPDFILAIPFVVIALFLKAFLPKRIIFPLYSISLFPLCLYANGGMALFFMFLVAGCVSVTGYGRFGKGWKQFLLALISFSFLAVMYLAFNMLDMIEGDYVTSLLKLFFSSFLTVACYPLIFLFEKIFNLVSETRLLDLADTSNPLLRQLEKKAPGTFQHSLQVMNMADSAARSIGADPLLIRAGALYHDVGKMNNPQCFVENESLLNKREEEKYHSLIEPIQSAKDIVRHVSDGVELSERNGLPDLVIDFIRSHHGTSVVKYFWFEHLKKGGLESDKQVFCYPGPKPRSSEQVILMLCDSIEAASRSLHEYTPKAYSDFVEKMVDDKMESGQLDDAEISIKELGIVKENIKTYLSQMHHERIAYPEEKKAKPARKQIFTK